MSADQLFDLWLSAVGGNSSLLLNVPPSPEGLLAEPDVQSLKGLGSRIGAFREALASAHCEAKTSSASAAAAHLVDGDQDTFWHPDDDDDAPAITLTFPRPTTINAVVIEEAIEHGQRIEQLRVTGTLSDGTERVLGQVGTVGYRRILRFDDVEVSSVTLHVDGSRLAPMVSRAAAVRI